VQGARNGNALAVALRGLALSTRFDYGATECDNVLRGAASGPQIETKAMKRSANRAGSRDFRGEAEKETEN